MIDGRSWLARAGIPIVIATVAAWIVAPSLGSGWYGDDAWYSGLPGALDSGRTTLLGAITHSYELWLTGNGRWYPGLIIEKYLVFATFADLVAYKIFVLAATLAALETARRFFASMWGTERANAAALLACLCFQERDYHDPFLSYNGMIQCVTIFTFASLIFLRRWLMQRKRSYLAWSIACYALSTTIYEITYLFGILHVIVSAEFRRWRNGIPFLIIGTALGVMSIALRIGAHVTSRNLYALRADPVCYTYAFTDQLTGAFPLTYVLATAPPNLPVSFPLAAVLFVAGFTVFSQLHRYAEAPVPSEVRFATALIVVPALLVPLAAKYQHELHPGSAYLPVFIEELGVGLLIAWLIRIGLRRGGRPMIVVFAVAAALIGTVTSAMNHVTVGKINRTFLTPRDSFQRSLANGLVATVPTGTRVAIVPHQPWVCTRDTCPDGVGTSDVIYRFARKTLDVVDASDAVTALAYDASRDRWFIASGPEARARTNGSEHVAPVEPPDRCTPER